MPAQFCKNCIWGMVSKDPENKGIVCTNPKLENVQSGNVMPDNARACFYYNPLPDERNEQNI